MVKNIETNVGTALTRIDFIDDDGMLLGFLKVNLSDARLIGRLGKFATFFRDYASGKENRKNVSLNQAAAEQFCELLGYDCKDTLFGVLGPTSVLASGEMFAGRILRAITSEFVDEAKRRLNGKISQIEKHTEKYNHDGL